MTPPPRPRRATHPTAALFVRIPTEQADRLDRAAFALGRAKQDLVASLVEHYVDPDSPNGLSALQDDLGGQDRRPLTVGPGQLDLALGHHRFVPNRLPENAPEVMTLEQAAELLQVEPQVIATLAERGEVPARRLGSHWRLSRRALIEWLGAPEPERPSRAGGARRSARRPNDADR